MRLHKTAEFRALLARLPEHFKRVHARSPAYSVRIGAHYRALGYFEGNIIVWIWVGPMPSTIA